MKHFMIRYRFANGTTEAWHAEIARFITALDNDPELKGRIVYRCLKQRDDASYFHLASAADDQAVKTLQQRDFFKHYTDATKARLRRRDPGVAARDRRRDQASGVNQRATVERQGRLSSTSRGALRVHIERIH